MNILNMNILNKNKRSIFLLTLFIFTVALVIFKTPITAQASIEDAMKKLGCNTAKNCDAFCEVPKNNASGICEEYWEFEGNLSDLEYAKKRLDYCTTIEDCNNYCETHSDWDCREYYGLQKDPVGLGKFISKLQKTEQVFLAGGGPGGCNSKYSCMLYCGSHFEECKSFSIDGFEATYAQPVGFHSKIQATISLKTALENNIPLPAVCQKSYIGYNGCLSYCNPERSPKPDCVDYLKKTGFLSSVDSALLDLKIQGKTPGAGNPRYNNGCHSVESCDKYCISERSHAPECLAFAEQYGLIVTAEELPIYRKLAPLIERGAGAVPTFGKYCGSECGCKSVAMCKAACDSPENYTECLELAKEIEIVEEVVSPEKQAVLNAMKNGEGPGGCNDEASCRTYCEGIDHISECVVFVEKFNLATPEELKEMRQMASIKEGGIKFPGNCQTQEKCFNYCGEPSHLDECVEFGQKAGFVKPEEVEEYKKVAPYLASGQTPGKCKTKEDCMSYCENTEHIEECFAFAEKAGLIPKDELEGARKAIEFMKKGESPGGCKSKEQCMAYCEGEGHMQECLEFGLKAGFISDEEAQMARTFIEKGGPGGCKSRSECESFCNSPANQIACMEFAVEAGMIAPEDAEFFKQNMAQQQGDDFGGFEKMPAKMKQCLSDKLGQDVAEKMTSKEVAPSKEMMHVMRLCIEEFQNSCPAFANQQVQELRPEEGVADQSVGPQKMDPAGEKCFKEVFGEDVLEKMQSGDFCPPANMEELLKPCFEKEFGGQMGPGGEGGGQFPSGGGPGGCKTQEECQAYCQAHPEECQGLNQQSDDQQQGQMTGEQCAQYQGQWDGTNCIFPNQQNPTGQQQNSGGMTSEECSKQNGTWDGSNCIFPQQQQQSGNYCESFATVPSCSYVGPVDSDNYKLCKQCYPDK